MTLRSAFHVKALVTAVLLALSPLHLEVSASGSAKPDKLEEIRRLAGEALPLLGMHEAPQPLPEHVLLDGEERETSLGSIPRQDRTGQLLGDLVSSLPA